MPWAVMPSGFCAGLDAVLAAATVGAALIGVGLGALGLLGGLTVFFNGPGGAALAMAGGLAAAGFTLTLKQTFDLDRLLDDELVVGACILMLAIITGSIDRVTARTRRNEAEARADRLPVSGRRIY